MTVQDLINELQEFNKDLLIVPGNATAHYKKMTHQVDLTGITVNNVIEEEILVIWTEE
ncbi:MAG: hypothetical protein GY861_05790 [bacterium]|nr:hypothetical protein [bacterium]